MSDATKEIAGGLAAELLMEGAQKGMKVDESTIEALTTPEPPEAVTEAPVAVETPSEIDTRSPGEQIEAEAREEMESPDSKFVEMPDFKPVSDEEFLAFDEEEALEDVSDARVELNEDEELDVEDLDMDEIKRRLHKAEKALEAQRRLRARQQEDKWRAEAKERYPLADVESIQASSRNQFMKSAAKSHNVVYTHLEPQLKKLEEMKRQIAEQTRAEERAKAASDWGKATVGPTVGDVDMAAYEKEIEAARRTGNLAKVIGVRRKFGL